MATHLEFSELLYLPVELSGLLVKHVHLLLVLLFLHVQNLLFLL